MGQGASLREAWDKAFATDKQAPFGGIIAVNRPLDGACAEAIAEIFSEVIVAPDFTPEALAILQKKKNLRLLKVLKSPLTAQPWDVRSVGADSFLLQERDLKTTTRGGFENRHEAAADGGGVERDAVRLARGEACEVQRHCLCGGGPDAGHRRGPDEPRGCQPHRGLEGGRGETVAQRQRGLQRRVLSRFPTA